MSSASNLLTAQFLAWVASGRRTHADVMATWQTSCPRLSIWEDAMIGGLLRFTGDSDRAIALTARGLAQLEAQSPVATRLAAD